MSLAELPALVLFLLVFSFLYTVIPLAFWGRTPGMTWAGLAAHGADGDMLTFSETARRWAGDVVTVVLLALPLLLVLGGGPSLGDRWSGTHTVYRG